MNWFKIWFKNARSIALPQSLMPAITALVLGLGIDGFNFIAAVIAVVGVVFAHLGMNLADEYFREKKKNEILEAELELKDKELYSLKHELINLQLDMEKLQKESKAKGKE
jgi:1,4-dihydroxy-2-naphthoate octaprenyltransferase